MFKQNALEPLKKPPQTSLIAPAILGAIKEALLLKQHLDHIKESIVFFVAQIKTDDSFELAVQKWNSVVVVNIKTLTSVSWEYISDEIIIVEHAGLSTYSLNWSKQFIEQSKSISIQMQIARDFLDVNQIITLAETLYDLITTTSYNVEVYLSDYVRTALGEFEFGKSQVNYLDWEDKQ